MNRSARDLYFGAEDPMKTPTIPGFFLHTLPLWAALLGGSAPAVASGDLRVPEVAFAMLAATTVADQALLECRLADADVATTVDLKIAGEWIATDGEIVDAIAASSPISAVTAQFQPAAGREQRMRFRAQGSATWGAWTGWTTGRISHTTAVPAAGQTVADEFEASTRPVNGTPTIAAGGYIRIKKLNSGG